MVKMQQALVDMVQGIRHNVVVTKQKTLVQVIHEESFGVPLQLWSSKP